MDETGQNIAADRVGAERIGDRSALLPERGLEKGRIVGEDRGMRRNEIGEQRQQNQTTITTRPATAPKFALK
jgi:hypothetical protein